MSTPVPTRELIDATRQLAVLARLGFPLADGLRQMGDRPRWLRQMADDLEAGASLEGTVRRHPRLFSEFYAGMVRAATASQKPQQLLEILSEWLERAWQVRRRVRMLLIYPFLVLNVALLQLWFVTGWVLPMVLPLQRDLPAVLTLVLQPWTGLLLIGLVNGVLTLTPFIQNLPPVGALRQLAEQALLTRGVASLLAAGLPLPQALEQAAGIVTVAPLQGEVKALAEQVRRGDRLSQALARAPHLDPLMASASLGGEETEDLAVALFEAADALDGHLERRTGYYLQMVEPWAVLAVGTVVLLVLLAFWAPFYTVVRNIS